MWLTRVLSSIIFLSAVIFTVPLAFDVGGRTCGLAFSLSLATYYFFYSTLRLITPDHSKYRRALIHLIAWTQWLVIPTLMIWSLNKFSVDADHGAGWVRRTFDFKRARDTTLSEWLFGRGGLVETVTIGGWDKILHWSTPVFQIGLLVVSASIISSSVYFLWRITTFPEISNVDAILIGAAITCAIFLCSWGIGSGRGNPVESSLLFAYVTLCIYQIFTDYQPSHPMESPPPPSQPALPPLPPLIMASYTTLVHVLSSLPSTIHSAFNFVVAAIMTITPSVIISLAYRVFVMYSAARIIPAIQASGARALSQEPSLDDDDQAGQALGFLSWFSPSILIAVYTSLLMQHFASTSGEGGPGEWWTSQGGDAGGNLWRWINLACTMGLYAIELYLGKADDDTRLTSHWKSD